MTEKAFYSYTLIVFLCMALPFIATFSHAGMLDENGMAPWETCGLCHGINGISVMGKFPKLAGQKFDYLQKQIKDFHSGNRRNDGGQMSAIISEIDESSIDSIANYFSQLPTPKTKSLNDIWLIEQYELGKKRYTLKRDEADDYACADCHDTKIGTAPFLAAQHGDYLRKQLKDFRSQTRDNDDHKVMRKIAKTLSDKEINALAIFLEFTPLSKTAGLHEISRLLEPKVSFQDYLKRRTEIDNI